MDKLNRLETYNECSNTDIEKTFRLILGTAVANHLSQDELPDTVLVISDMEFDGATIGDPNKALFKNIAKEFAKHGYKLPKLAFWDVNSYSGAIPITENENGVILVSGYSTAIAKMVLSDKTDPFDAIAEQVMSDRYAPVEEALKESGYIKA